MTPFPINSLTFLTGPPQFGDSRAAQRVRQAELATLSNAR